jgi:hypothetical protein
MRRGGLNEPEHVIAIGSVHANYGLAPAQTLPTQ